MVHTIDSVFKLLYITIRKSSWFGYHIHSTATKINDFILNAYNI